MSHSNELPSLLSHLNQLLPLVSQTRLGLVVDFDGTISEIAPTPDEAIINPCVADSLRSLAAKLTLVSVVSGRSAGEVRDKVGLDGAIYVGNHGAEYLSNDHIVSPPGVSGHIRKLKAAFEQLRAVADGPGMIWQDKGLSASAHYRLAPNPKQARRKLQAALDSVGELEIFWGKMVLELRAPTGLDKGSAVRKLVHENRLDAVIYIGDDTTDVDALRAVRELGVSGTVLGLGAAVLHNESPPELLNFADYVLDGVPEVAEFLRWLDEGVN